MGREPLEPAYATLLGAVRSLRQEYPALSSQLLDVELAQIGAAPAALVDALLGDMSAEHADVVLAYRGAHRWLPALELAARHDEPTTFRAQGTYLVTGALGGLGLALAEQLVQRFGARLVLTGRSQPREPEQARLAALEAQGAELLVMQADVTRADDMERVMRAASERFGALHGVIHAAGSAQAGLVDALTPEALARELAPKASGARVLAALSHAVPLDFVVYLSSLTALSGGVAQAAYAAANAFLDAHAMRSSRCGARVLSVGLDRFESVGMAARAEAHLRELGFELPSLPSLSAEGLVSLLLSALSVPGASHVLIAAAPLDGLPRDELGALLRERLLGDRTGSTAAVPPLADGLDLAGIRAHMQVLWARALGVDDIDPTRDFQALGGESLLALQILNRVRETFAVELGLHELFEHRTVAALSQRVHALRAQRASAANEPPDEPALVAVPRRTRRAAGAGKDEP
jgi:NADP-dependent 3-hydroxy acid dehydrogenase YdfG/acyl carrier protein